VTTLLALSGCDATFVQQSGPAPGSEAPSQAPSEQPAEEPEAAFDPIRLRGRGNRVARFRIPRDAAAIAEIKHRGSSNFAVWTVNRGGRKLDLLVNTIGNYEGTVLFDEQEGQHSVAFQIEADGQWNIRVLPVTEARQWNGRKQLTGKGDSVIRLNPSSSGLATTRIQHRGSSNFAVEAYGETYDLLVNEIGRYRGESLLPNRTVLLEITADGQWTFSPLK
jgi:hypothetical protein